MSLRDLRDLARLRNHWDFQLKATWCGPQTETIRTIVLGTVGRHLGIEKYRPLRQPGWSYGNDASELVRFFQLTEGNWARLLDVLVEADWDSRGNPESPEPAEQFHVVLAASDYLPHQVRYCELFLGPDTPSLRALVAKMLGPQHAARPTVERQLFRGY